MGRKRVNVSNLRTYVVWHLGELGDVDQRLSYTVPRQQPRHCLLLREIGRRIFAQTQGNRLLHYWPKRNRCALLSPGRCDLSLNGQADTSSGICLRCVHNAAALDRASYADSPLRLLPARGSNHRNTNGDKNIGNG